VALEADLKSHESVLVGGSGVAEAAKDVGNGIGLVLGEGVAIFGIAVAFFEIYECLVLYSYRLIIDSPNLDAWDENF
jgi:hypothetical protein